MKQKSKIYILVFFVLTVGMLGTIGFWVVKTDPFFHYHKPMTDQYFYRISNARNQNDGITRQFTYDALITGTSMTENFKASEMDILFGVQSVKVPYSGATYKEINDSLRRALAYNPELKTIVRSLDMNNFQNDKDAMAYEEKDYPLYLYDDWILNDVHYLFNRDVIFERVYPMLADSRRQTKEPGITSFDEYASTTPEEAAFGKEALIGMGYTMEFRGAGETERLTEEKEEVIRGNVRQNVTALAKEYPDVTFYCFVPPYSIVWWKDRMEEGRLYSFLEAEQIIVEEILQCPNIKLYSFNNRRDITTDLSNYRDAVHYGDWINSRMLQWMHDGEDLLTENNYREYLAQEYEFYTTYDYSSLADAQDEK